ncbi:pleckstrin homology domain-containing family S member 1 isoform X2 [Pseudophryne corroboree]|uniref:pleckstrin homology domain-containing family S member 1 isoform X2 n=1 Tax=Pseudophryne corroboree TaxID=495146 RepID=UPI0030817AFA
MFTKRRSSEIDQQVIKQGSLLKSPPLYIFNNRSSWKRRLFKLCKNPTDSYVIKYYEYDGRSENLKGDIDVSSITDVELGTKTMDKNLGKILRLHNTSPENMLCIKTEDRNYYLLDDTVDTITDWYKSITDVWVKSNQTAKQAGPRITHTIPLHAAYQTEATRPISCPEHGSGIRLSSAEARDRSHTDPGNQCSVGVCNQELPRNSPEQPIAASQNRRSVTHSDLFPDWAPVVREIRRRSDALADQDNLLSSRLSGDTTDGAYSSEPESIYDIPRSVLMSKRDSQQSAEQDETSDLDSSDGDVYQEMGSVAAEETISCPPKPPRRTSTPTDPHRYRKTQGSRLKKTYILKMMYEQQDNQSELEKINMTVPTEHFKNYLAVEEVADRLYVCKWNGPVEIGCRFHHRDHIDAINGFRLANKESFSDMLNKFILDEVNLVVFRNKKAEIFHVDGCSCSRS